MALEPKSFHHLLNMHFIIPPYQRGYRWDQQQVTDLLHDLHTFVRQYCGPVRPSTPDGRIPYYCLQPIAVVKDTEQPDTYHVVDGQQRLTTIYLLLHFIKDRISFIDFPIYDLSMPSRDLQAQYLNKQAFKDDRTDYTSNIDNFYMRQAYKTIESWYDSKGENAKEMFKILNLFIEQPGGGEQIDVRVIWYEINNRSPLDAFRNLNYGKIPLTSTELVKALLMQGEESPTAGQHLRGAAYRRALEWDSMEHTLQNPALWSMLSDNKDTALAHIEIVLDFVADRLNEEMWEEDKDRALSVNGDASKVRYPFQRKSRWVLEQGKILDNFNYNVIDEYIRRHGTKSIDDKIWHEICVIFNLIKNWYDNREWYHLIGLYRIVQRDRKHRGDFLKKIYAMSTEIVEGADGRKTRRPLNRSTFASNLKTEIGNAIKLIKDLKLNDLRYGTNNDDIIRILKAVNVKCAMDDKTEGNRFAFDLFDRYNVTSLEHIHPQNITTDASYDDFCNWVNRRGEDFYSLSITDFINIVKRKANGDSDEETLRIEAEDLRGESKEALITLKRMTKTPKMYKDESNKEMITEASATFDRLFEEMAGITEAELHSIKNMALVDKDTNSALQNYFLDRKRDILSERHEACGKRQAKSTYAPPSTRRVFSKYYSRRSPGDMRLWGIDDRNNYYDVIEETYNYFTAKQ